MNIMKWIDLFLKIAWVILALILLYKFNKQQKEREIEFEETKKNIREILKKSGGENDEK